MLRSGLFEPANDQTLSCRQVHYRFRLRREKLVHGKTSARTGIEAVVVAKDEAPIDYAIVEKLQRVPCRLIEVDVQMDQ